MTRGVYPGTFNPPTIGHLAIIEAAIAQRSLSELDLVMSRRPLLKGTIERPTLDERVAVLEASVAHLDVVSVRVTDLTLIADIAEGYDVVIMGADKWAQVNDPVFYDDDAHRTESLARLPRLAIAGRGDAPVPDEHRLHVDGVDHVSSTAARAGANHLMTPAARAFVERTGAWGG